MDLAGFGESIGGEFVAGGLIATVNGKKQYLYQNGVFTLVGRAAYLAWEHRPKLEPDVAIALPEPEPRHKLHKSRR